MDSSPQRTHIIPKVIVQPPSGKSRGFESPEACGSGTPNAETKSLSPLLGKGNSLKLAVRRYIGKNRMFYLAQTVLKLSQEERRASEELVDTFQAARKIRVQFRDEDPKEKEDKQSGKTKKWRKRISESLADRIENERKEIVQNTQKKNTANGEAHSVAKETIHSVSETVDTSTSKQVLKTWETPPQIVKANSHLDVPKTAERNNNKEAVPRADTEHHEDDKEVTSESTTLKPLARRRRSKSVQIEESERKSILHSIEHRLLVSELVLEAVLENCGLNQKRSTSTTKEKSTIKSKTVQKTDSGTQTGLSPLESMHDKVLHVDARLLGEEISRNVGRRDYETKARNPTGGKVKSHGADETDQRVITVLPSMGNGKSGVITGRTKPTCSVIPTLSRIEETQSSVNFSNSSSQSSFTDVDSGEFVQESSKESKTCANLSRKVRTKGHFETVTVPASVIREGISNHTSRKLNLSRGDKKRRNIISIDLLNIYDSNACLQKVDAKSVHVQKRHKVSVKGPKVDTNRHNLKNVSKRKHDLTPLPPKSMKKSPRGEVASSMGSSVDSLVTSDNSGCVRQERVTQFLDYYMKYQKEKQRTRYSHPNKTVLEEFRVSVSDSVPEPAPEPYLHKSKDEERWGVLQQPPRSARRRSRRRDTQTSKLKEAIAGIGTAPSLMTIKASPNTTVSRSTRVQRLYKDFHGRRNGNYTMCKQLPKRNPPDQVSLDGLDLTS